MSLRKFRYRLLSHLSFGKTRQRYRQKYKELKRRDKEKKHNQSPVYITQEKLIEKNKYIIVPQQKEILIIFLDAIGDYILFRNFLKSIKNSPQYRHYKITLLGNERFRAFAEYLDTDCIDTFLWLPHRIQSQPSDVRENWRMNLHNRQGMKHYYDTIIYASFNSQGKRPAIDNLLSEVTAREKIINLDNRHPQNNKTNDFLDFTYVSVNYAAIKLFEFDINKFFWEDVLNQKINIPYPFIEKEKINQQNNPLADCHKYVVINPCAQDGYRMWHMHNWAETIRYLKTLKYNVILVCAENEKDYCAALAAETDVDIPVYANLPVPQLLALLKAAQLYIGHDSGCFHIAAACDIKALCLSAGYAFFRFMGYPKNRDNITILFPKGVEKWISENPSTIFNNNGFFINSLKTRDVIKAAEKLLTASSSHKEKP